MKGRCLQMEDLKENTSNYTEEEKEGLIKKEVSRLKRIFKDIDKSRKDTTISLIENAAFMSVTLKDLQKTINKNGATSVYQNGENQWGTKKSPEADVYNTMIKNHSAIIKQLTELLPKQIIKPDNDGFDEFINRR